MKTPKDPFNPIEGQMELFDPEIYRAHGAISVLPGRRSTRAISNTVEGDPVAFSRELPRRSSSTAKAERSWQQKCEAARRRIFDHLAQHPEQMGTGWLVAWQTRSDPQAQKAFEELRVRVFRWDDPRYDFFVRKRANTVVVAVFPRHQELTPQQKRFHAEATLATTKKEKS
jgi:hypothetical protein